MLPFSLKRLRALLRERRVGRVEILKRGSALEPEQLRRDLRLAGDAAASLVLTRVAGAPTVLLWRPVPAFDSPVGRRVSLSAWRGREHRRQRCSTEAGCAHAHPYDVSPDAPTTARWSPAALGVAAGAGFKSLVTEVDGALTVAVVPVTGELDLKALAGRGRRQAGGAGRPGPGRAGHRLRPRRHQPARPAQTAARR